jgi:hypothetical protein
MRRFIFRSLLVALCAIAIGAVWIFAGRQLSLLIDRFGTREIERIPITELRYEGAATGGHFRFGTAVLGATGADSRPFALSVTADRAKNLIVAASGKSFPLGEVIPPSGSESSLGFTVRPDKDDDAALVVRRSYLSWPTPFDFNFMTGHAPSWKRHRYYQLVWRKHSGAKLEMLWRFEQYFYPADRWSAGDMTREASTGLIKVTIAP